MAVSFATFGLRFLRHRRRAWSLLELVVVLGILGLLGAVALNSIQAARESARQLHCLNNLRQVGLGTLSFESARQHYPTGGWGWRWVADSEVHPRYGQPGGWIYQLLPYLESGKVYDLPRVSGDRNSIEIGIHKLLATSCTLFHCPTRGNSKLVPFNGERISRIFNLETNPSFVALTDYAANGGTKQISSAGPKGRSLMEIDSHLWTSLADSNGMMLYHNRIRPVNVTAGLSNVLWVAEKFVGHLNYDFDFAGGNDQSLYSGEGSDIRRFANSRILPETLGGNEVNVIDGDTNTLETTVDYGSKDAFGSPHPNTMNSVMADGSTRRLDLDIDIDLFRRLSMRHAPND
jgi:type II secretory pathway pseudopilin PulG